jgi:hypothetical protein
MYRPAQVGSGPLVAIAAELLAIANCGRDGSDGWPPISHTLDIGISRNGLSPTTSG